MWRYYRKDCFINIDSQKCNKRPRAKRSEENFAFMCMTSYTEPGVIPRAVTINRKLNHHKRGSGVEVYLGNQTRLEFWHAHLTWTRFFLSPSWMFFINFSLRLYCKFTILNISNFVMVTNYICINFSLPDIHFPSKSLSSAQCYYLSLIYWFRERSRHSEKWII